MINCACCGEPIPVILGAPYLQGEHGILCMRCAGELKKAAEA